MAERVPLSPTHISQVHPQYSMIDERQISRYQPWSPETYNPSLITKDSNPEESGIKSCTKHCTTKLWTCIFIGLVICGIPLAVMTFLYVQKKNSSSTDTGSTTSSSLPSQCSTYTANSDATRLATFTGCIGCSYDTSSYFPVGWYRFTSGAGTRLATMPPNTGSCGASYPAWYNGTYPSTAGSTISSTVCVHVSGSLCSTSYPISISVTNCNGFYVFYLPSATNANIRYCTTF